MADWGALPAGVRKARRRADPAPYLCVGNLYLDSADGYDRSIAAAGSILRGDIPNFTNVKPVRLISEVLD